MDGSRRENDAGDVFAYDTEGLKTKAENENQAADKIFGILPDDQKQEFISLWMDNKVTPEMILARNRENADLFPLIWQHIQEIIRDSLEKDYIREAY